MSNLIERAAQRLEQLRQAGVEGIEPPVAAAAAPRIVSPLRAQDPSANRVNSRRVELDLLALAARGIITPNAPRSLAAEQYRTIKRPLIRNATGRGASAITHGNLIMVTSAVAGEGKTFTSINLAFSIAAELDHTVMLVEADVARPSVLHALGEKGGLGLLDVLESRAEIPDVLYRTNVDKLTILPSGTYHARATELLASDAMRRLLDDVATRYSDRIVIFDSPPLIQTSEARVLASHMGQIVLVVHAEKTLQSDVQQALSMIEACPVRLLLLNQARTKAEAGYGDGYGYGYGAKPFSDPAVPVT